MWRVSEFIAHTSAMRYKKSEYNTAQIGRDVNVDFVLEGSVHLAFRQDLMAAQLINVRDQMQLSPQVPVVRPTISRSRCLLQRE